MKMLSKEELVTIERQIYNKARDLDVALYNALFDDMGKEFILDSLMLYVNRDGGFGSALEIDNYNPNSSVYQTYEALRILDAYGFDKNCTDELYVQMMNKIGNYLFNRSPLTDGLWNPLVKTNDDFAHSEEYNYMENPFSIWGVHPTAAILGYMLTSFPENKAYYKKALKQLNFVFAYLDAKKSFSTYDFISFNQLLGSLKKLEILKEEQGKIEERLIEEAMLHLEDKDFPFAAYLSNASLPDSLKACVDANLDMILSSRASHGLWEHKKGWGSTRYPEADSAALKWIGAESVWNLFLLKQYGRIEQ